MEPFKILMSDRINQTYLFTDALLTGSLDYCLNGWSNVGPLSVQAHGPARLAPYPRRWTRRRSGTSSSSSSWSGPRCSLWRRRATSEVRGRASWPGDSRLSIVGRLCLPCQAILYVLFPTTPQRKLWTHLRCFIWFKGDVSCSGSYKVVR